MKPISLFAGIAMGLACLATQAQEFKLGPINIAHPYARATTSGQPMGGGFLRLENSGADDTLLSASAEVAKAVELHLMSMEGDVMRMRQVERIALPAGQTVELKPGGLHIMLMGLKAPLKAGDSFPLKLKFEKAGEVTVSMTVQAAASGAGDMHHDMKH